jgi:subtilisin family serine protease
VADGNQIVNMSLGGDMRQPTDAISRKVEQYAREKGVVFVIAAGNAANHGGGVGAPSNAPSAMSIGALNVNDRVATFSSYGENFDPAKLSPTIKTIYLAPGTEIEAAAMPSGFQQAPYQNLQGTSMATPHAAGVTALLMQQARQMGRWTSPLELSQAVQDAIRESARPIPRNQLPADVPPDQEFLVVDPAAAYKALRGKANAVAK